MKRWPTDCGRGAIRSVSAASESGRVDRHERQSVAHGDRRGEGRQGSRRRSGRGRGAVSVRRPARAADRRHGALGRHRSAHHAYRPAHESCRRLRSRRRWSGRSAPSTPRSRSLACARWMRCSTNRSAGRDSWRSCSAHSRGWRCCWQSSARMACCRSWSRSGGARSAFVSRSARRAAASSRSSRSRGSSSCPSVLPRDLRVRLALNRLLASLLFGVEPTDPGTLAAVTSTIAMVAALACGLPAWRASRLDPNVVLRGG